MLCPQCLPHLGMLNAFTAIGLELIKFLHVFVNTYLFFSLYSFLFFYCDVLTTVICPMSLLINKQK
jgi:hypothetical protein